MDKIEKKWSDQTLISPPNSAIHRSATMISEGYKEGQDKRKLHVSCLKGSIILWNT